MRAVVFRELGGPTVAHVREIEPPEPGPGEVLIEVVAASANPIDLVRMAGNFGPVELPGVTGVDAAGVVTRLGPGVDHLEVGDSVFGIGRGTHAEQAVLFAAVRKPETLRFIEAAAAGVAGETAHRVLTQLDVTEGCTVLIDGASGGVGTFAVQLAVERGARVVATSSAANHQYLRSLGATAIDYGEGLAERVAEVAPDGVDAVFDVAGKSDLAALVSIAPRPEQVVSIANQGASEIGARFSAGADLDRNEGLQAVADLADRHRLTIPIDKVYTFDQASEAFALGASGHVRGKLVLVPRRQAGTLGAG